MERLVIENAVLSTSGQLRLSSLSKKASMVIVAMLENQVPRLKERIAEFAPTPQEEMDLISYPGSAYDFVKDTFIPVQTAIINERYFIDTISDVVTVKLGKCADIDPLIGFKWFHGNAELRSSDDGDAGEAWRNMLERWENGGSGPFVITARDGGSLTIFKADEDTHGLPRNPEAVMKDFPWLPRGMPFTMYQNGGNAFRATLLARSKEALQNNTTL